MGDGDRSVLVDRIEASLAQSLGGRNLIGIDMRSDLALAAQLDLYDGVPDLDKSTWSIR